MHVCMYICMYGSAQNYADKNSIYGVYVYMGQKLSTQNCGVYGMYLFIYVCMYVYFNEWRSIICMFVCVYTKVSKYCMYVGTVYM